MVAVSDFSGLTSSAWAFASAAASAATDSLDRGMAGLGLPNIEAYRARFRSLGAHAVPDRLLGILGHQDFELAFRPFVIEKGTARGAEYGRELRPRIGRAHVYDADGLNPRPRRLGIDEMGRLAELHAAPELLFRRDQDTQ